MASQATVSNFDGSRTRLVRWADAQAGNVEIDAPLVIFDDVRGHHAGERFGPAVFASVELDRATRFRHRLSRAEYLGARGIVRSFLAPRVGLAPAAIRFEAPRNEKPKLVDGESTGIDVSVSHSGGRVACAFLRDGEIGVDVETLERPHLDVVALAPRVLSRAEVDALGRVPPDDVQRLFLHVWTRKEAVLKAAGVGLAVPTDGFDVLRWSAAGVEDISPVCFADRQWRCESLLPEPHVELAVAYG